MNFNDLRFLILSEGNFGPMSSKTANGVIRYTPERCVAVLDSTKAGKTAQDVIGFGGTLPVIASFDEGVKMGANALMIGIAPSGGRLPENWRGWIRKALEQKLEVWSGLHMFLGEDEEFAALSKKHGTPIHDLRKPPANLPISAGRVRTLAATVVLTVGSDCNVGKMTASLQFRDGLRKKGQRVAFAGTGQTGILIEGWGIGVDAVVSDFVGGAAEQLTMDAAKDADIVLVEGQGSLIHPGYSAVTYGLIHGSLPHAFILCTQPSRQTIDSNDWVRIPPLKDLIAMHEQVMQYLRPAKVIGISMNTYDLSEAAAQDAIKRAQDETGLPATDPVRYDAAPLVDVIDAFHRNRIR